MFLQSNFPDLLVGLDEPDDSAVMRIAPDVAIISTTDFFPPVVDDPYDFGAIAAANALSDVYAMGGEPILAINLVAFPDGHDLGILSEILRGGGEKVRESGAVLAGGHTVSDKEPKYGLSVIGRIHPDKVVRKSGAQAGDVLILSKPLGIGVITTALKRGMIDEAILDEAVTGMKRLNAEASRLAVAHNVHAMTDITGYGLLGHGYEMANLSRMTFKLRYDALHWYTGAVQYAQEDIFAGGMYRNREYYQQWVDLTASLEDWQEYLLYDPQTSGGLLMAVSPAEAGDLLKDLQEAGERAVVIGEVSDEAEGRMVIV